MIQLCSSGIAEIKREATYALMNCTTEGTEEQVDCLIENKYLVPYCAQLRSDDNDLACHILNSLSNLLARGKVIADRTGFDNKYALAIEEAGGLDDIEGLQDSMIETLSNLAIHIITDYFDSNGVISTRQNQFSF